MKFPTQYNAIDIVTADLKAKLKPLQERLIEIENERFGRRKIRKQQGKKADVINTSDTANMEADPAGSTDAQKDDDKAPPPDILEDESTYREKELAELEALINPDLKEDIGASVTGMYELVGKRHTPYTY